jgi:hypothetical protein
MARRIVQTSCSRCGHDVEGYLSAPHDWHDRGGNTHCLSWYSDRDRYDENGVPRTPPHGLHTVSREELSRIARHYRAEERQGVMQRMGERAYAKRYGRRRIRRSTRA